MTEVNVLSMDALLKKWGIDRIDALIVDAGRIRLGDHQADARTWDEAKGGSCIRAHTP